MCGRYLLRLCGGRRTHIEITIRSLYPTNGLKVGQALEVSSLKEGESVDYEIKEGVSGLPGLRRLLDGLYALIDEGGSPDLDGLRLRIADNPLLADYALRMREVRWPLVTTSITRGRTTMS